MFDVNHVAISVENLDECIDFYSRFGFKVIKEYHDEAVDIVMLKLKRTRLEMFHYLSHSPLPAHAKTILEDLQTVGTKHFALGTKDIEKAREFVIKLGCASSDLKIQKGRLGKPYFFISDPNGILVEIIEK